MVVPILSVHPVPQPRQQRLERGVGEREAATTATGGLRCESRQQDEDAHLHEHDGALSVRPRARATRGRGCR